MAKLSENLRYVILSVAIFFVTGNLPPKHKVNKVDQMKFLGEKFL
jgi:hypothetical protein